MFTIDVYKDEKAPVYALLLVTLKKYGFDCFQWEPALLRDAIENDYSIKLTDRQSDKIQAGITLLDSDHYEHDWRAFEILNHLINNQAVDYEDLAPLEAEELIVGIAEATLLKKDVLDSDETLIFGDEVRAYAGHVFWEYGLHSPPKLFPTAIMPASKAPGDDTEKNEALKEMFDTHVEQLLDYLEKIE